MLPNKKIQDWIGSKIQIETKGEKYILVGILKSVDDYLNLHMVNTIELLDGKKSRALGSVIVRGNNIVLINPVNE